MTPQNKPHSPCTRGREETVPDSPKIPNLRPKAEIACDACRRAHAKCEKTSKACCSRCDKAGRPCVYSAHARKRGAQPTPACTSGPSTDAGVVRGPQEPRRIAPRPIIPITLHPLGEMQRSVYSVAGNTHPRPQDGRHHQPTAGHASTSSYTTRPPWEHTNHLATGIPRATNASAGDSVANYAHSGTTLNSATAAVPLFPDLNWTIDPQTFAVHNNVLSGHQYAPFPPCNEDGHAWY